MKQQEKPYVRFWIRQPKNKRRSFGVYRRELKTDGTILNSTVEMEEVSKINADFQTGVLTLEQALELLKSKVLPVLKSGREQVFDETWATAIEALANKNRRAASYRKLDWQLSNSDYAEIVKQDCHYCGSRPSNVFKYKGETLNYSGIDRKNNFLGYLLENCLPCCRRCNSMKSSLDYSDFLNHLIKIVGNRIS